MKHTHSRGTALPETALTIGLSLLLVLGAAQMAILGYTQISADGAAFIAAHTNAQNPSANGITTATGVFSQFSSSNFSTPSPSPSMVPMSVSKAVGGFSLMPGLASTYTVTGKDVEYAPAGGAATPAPFEFSIGTNELATLLNYCAPHGNCFLPSNYGIYLAQGVGNGNGNGVNGTFSEWRCHQRYYASVNWPSTRPANYNAIKGDKVLDPATNSSVEGNIYGWDTGNHKCT
jgi:hypothetical protein